MYKLYIGQLPNKYIYALKRFYLEARAVVLIGPMFWLPSVKNIYV